MFKREFVILGVVSLTMGNSPLPFGDGFVGIIKLCRKIELGVMVRLAIGRNVFCDGFAQSGFVGLQFGTSW